MVLVIKPNTMPIACLYMCCRSTSKIISLYPLLYVVANSSRVVGFLPVPTIEIVV